MILASAGLPEDVQLLPTVLILAVLFAVTVALRALPFAALRFFRESELVTWLGLVMPAGVMAILMVYALTGSDGETGGYAALGLGVGFTVALHLWKRSASLSILLGTLFYVVLVNCCLLYTSPSPRD